MHLFISLRLANVLKHQPYAFANITDTTSVANPLLDFSKDTIELITIKFLPAYQLAHQLNLVLPLIRLYFHEIHKILQSNHINCDNTKTLVFSSSNYLPFKFDSGWEQAYILDSYRYDIAHFWEWSCYVKWAVYITRFLSLFMQWNGLKHLILFYCKLLHQWKSKFIWADLSFIESATECRLQVDSRWAIECRLQVHSVSFYGDFKFGSFSLFKQATQLLATTLSIREVEKRQLLASNIALQYFT